MAKQARALDLTRETKMLCTFSHGNLHAMFLRCQRLAQLTIHSLNELHAIPNFSHLRLFLELLLDLGLDILEELLSK